MGEFQTGFLSVVLSGIFDGGFHVFTEIFINIHQEGVCFLQTACFAVLADGMVCKVVAFLQWAGLFQRLNEASFDDAGFSSAATGGTGAASAGTSYQVQTSHDDVEVRLLRGNADRPRWAVFAESGIKRHGV